MPTVKEWVIKAKQGFFDVDPNVDNSILVPAAYLPPLLRRPLPELLPLHVWRPVSAARTGWMDASARNGGWSCIESNMASGKTHLII